MFPYNKRCIKPAQGKAVFYGGGIFSAARRCNAVYGTAGRVWRDQVAGGDKPTIAQHMDGGNQFYGSTGRHGVPQVSLQAADRDVGAKKICNGLTLGNVAFLGARGMGADIVYVSRFKTRVGQGPRMQAIRSSLAGWAMLLVVTEGA